MANKKQIANAIKILALLGFPRAQQNSRSALCLLALIDLGPSKRWSDVTSPLMGITPIMDWIRTNYKIKYAPNTRETFRRQTMHQFVEAGLVLYNPDKPDRPVNSPAAVYQIEPSALEVLKTFESDAWQQNIVAYQKECPSLAKRFAKERDQQKVPVQIAPDREISLSPGKHNELIRKIIEDFCARYVPSGELVYTGDTGEKEAYFDKKLLSELGVDIDSHGKMPDVVIYCRDRRWLLLIESVTSHGPVDGKRHEELRRLFQNSSAGLVFVTAFPTKAIMGRYLRTIAWETEVWVADSPSHLIHFNGERFLGPYSS